MSLKKRIVIYVAVLVLAAAASLLFLYNYNQNVTDGISKNEASQKELSDDVEKKIAEIKKKQEDAKVVAAQAAAAKAAEDAKNVTPETASSVSKESSKSCNASTKHNNPANIDVFVNKKHCITPLSFVPSDLVTVNGATLSQKAASDFTAMFNAAAAAGQGFYVTSSYRSYSNQVSTYAHWVSVSGKDGADTYSARPGYSEHQTGLVVDVAANVCVLDCFGGTSQYQWLKDNSHKYGFIQRYIKGYESITGYKAEEWHYRYVGVAVAADMHSRGIKTLEDYWNMPGGGYY